MARDVLFGYGDASAGEWVEDRPRAFHLRRRLTSAEQRHVGDALDCRNSEEGRMRYEAIKTFLPEAALPMVLEELT